MANLCTNGNLYISGPHIMHNGAYTQYSCAGAEGLSLNRDDGDDDDDNYYHHYLFVTDLTDYLEPVPLETPHAIDSVSPVCYYSNTYLLYLNLHFWHMTVSVFLILKAFFLSPLFSDCSTSSLYLSLYKRTNK